MPPTKLALLLVPASLAFAAPRVAESCIPAPCAAGQLVPTRGAPYPANAPGVFWRPMDPAHGDPTQVVLTSLFDQETPIPFTATALDHGDFLLVPDAPLNVGEHYLVKDHSACDNLHDPGPGTDFDVTAAAPLPVALGTLMAFNAKVETIGADSVGDACVADVAASKATFLLTVAPEARPWLKLLHFTTYVDGAVWGQSASLDTEQQRGVFQQCASRDPDANPGVSAGSHELRIEARLPGTALVLTSSTTTVTVDCGPHTELPDVPSIHEGTSSCNAGGAGSLSWLGLGLAALLVRRRGRRIRAAS